MLVSTLDSCDSDLGSIPSLVGNLKIGVFGLKWLFWVYMEYFGLSGSISFRSFVLLIVSKSISKF